MHQNAQNAENPCPNVAAVWCGSLVPAPGRARSLALPGRSPDLALGQNLPNRACGQILATPIALECEATLSELLALLPNPGASDSPENPMTGPLDQAQGSNAMDLDPIEVGQGLSGASPDAQTRQHNTHIPPTPEPTSPTVTISQFLSLPAPSFRCQLPNPDFHCQLISLPNFELPALPIPPPYQIPSSGPSPDDTLNFIFSGLQELPEVLNNLQANFLRKHNLLKDTMKDFGEKIVQHVVLMEEALGTLQGHCQRNFAITTQNGQSLHKGLGNMVEYVKRLAVHSMSRVECQAHFDNFFHQSQSLFQEVAVQLGQIQSHISSLQGTTINFQQLPAIQAQMRHEVVAQLKTELRDEISTAISGLVENLSGQVMAQMRPEMLQAFEGHHASLQNSFLQALRKQEATITEIVRRLHHRLQILEKQPSQASKIHNLEVEVEVLRTKMNSIQMELQSWDEGWQGDPVPAPCPTFVASTSSTHMQTHPTSSTHFACQSF